MVTKQTQSNHTLRKIAEEKVRSKAIQDPKELSLDEAAKLLHELRIHQIEPETQNEELRRQDISQARYYDLYDNAPVGYVTLVEQDLILEANLSAKVREALDNASV
jgi:hypothetical protein